MPPSLPLVYSEHHADCAAPPGAEVPATQRVREALDGAQRWVARQGGEGPPLHLPGGPSLLQARPICALPLPRFGPPPFPVLNAASQDELSVWDLRILPNLNASYLPMMPDGSVLLVDDIW